MLPTDRMYDHVTEWGRTLMRRAILRVLIVLLRLPSWTPANLLGLLGTIYGFTTQVCEDEGEDDGSNPFRHHLLSISSNIYEYGLSLNLLTVEQWLPEWYIPPSQARFPSIHCILDAGRHYIHGADVTISQHIGRLEASPMDFINELGEFAENGLPLHSGERGSSLSDDLDFLPKPNTVHLNDLFRPDQLLAPAFALYDPHDTARDIYGHYDEGQRDTRREENRDGDEDGR
ncbi:hypothetical protein H0H93_007261 [Arthromyces matolae]|nr:hypothetical protein H0H93_007261 [Arthromyces matolae]